MVLVAITESEESYIHIIYQGSNLKGNIHMTKGSKLKIFTGLEFGQNWSEKKKCERVWVLFVGPKTQCSQIYI